MYERRYILESLFLDGGNFCFKAPPLQSRGGIQKHYTYSQIIQPLQYSISELTYAVTLNGPTIDDVITTVTLLGSMFSCAHTTFRLTTIHKWDSQLSLTYHTT
jgi:hypothetical protein